MEKSSLKKIIKTTLIILVVLAIVWVILYLLNLLPVQLIPRSSDSYQAVFLTNGQVYFGKLYREGAAFSVLTDVFYLQVAQSPQPLQAGQTPPTNINLVKLGGELHGPTDEMRINREQILFIEDLKSNSRVVQAIKQFKQ